MALFQHYRTDLYPGSGRDSFYAGCHDSPFKITGDCGPRQRTMERTVGSRPDRENYLGPQFGGSIQTELTQFRKNHGITILQLVQDIHVTDSILTHFEHGTLRTCLESTKEKLASFYGEDAVKNLTVVEKGRRFGP